MTTVHFIVAEDQCRLERRRMLCALAERRWAQGASLLIQAGSAQELNDLNDWLWTYNDISFLTHAMLGKAAADSTSILLTWDILPESEIDCLVNLAQGLPAYAGGCAAIYELVDHDPQYKQWARQRYRDYQAAGYEIETKRISNYAELAA